MNESTWLRETDPLRLLAARYPMRGHDSTQPQPRQSRMYLLACARKQWRRLPGVCRALVAVAEVYSDAPHQYGDARAAAAGVAVDLMNSLGTADDLTAAEIDLSFASLHGMPAGMMPTDVFERAEGCARAPDPPLEPDAWRGLASLVYLPFEPLTPAYAWVPPELHDVVLLRDVYGNPYRHTPFRDEWRTADAVLLASRIYAARSFSTSIFCRSLSSFSLNSSVACSRLVM